MPKTLVEISPSAQGLSRSGGTATRQSASATAAATITAIATTNFIGEYFTIIPSIRGETAAIMQSVAIRYRRKKPYSYTFGSICRTRFFMAARRLARSVV